MSQYIIYLAKSKVLSFIPLVELANLLGKIEMKETTTVQDKVLKLKAPESSMVPSY